ncbi:MnuA family membrane nuclease [Mycoplasmopsis adleri]|uniref:endonuclease/exonuclease/phosphatase family protein n=1 Tax=Mycoplasmopsis adleri TaxID=51362 RepID=UPI003873240C
MKNIKRLILSLGSFSVISLPVFVQSCYNNKDTKNAEIDIKDNTTSTTIIDTTNNETPVNPKPNEQPETGNQDPKPGNENPKPGNEDPKPGNENPDPGNEDPKPVNPDPNPGNENPDPGNEDPKPVNPDPEHNENSKINIGFWNVCNFGNVRNDNTYKVQSLSHIIYQNNYNLIGLVEVDGDNSVKSLTEHLNKLAKSDTYAYIQSDTKVGHKNLSSRSNVPEYASFIYNKHLLEVVPFENKKNLLVYDNSNWNSFGLENGLLQVGYMRPPVGVKFRTLGKIKNDFTYVIDHLDSPGAKDNEKKYKKTSQGTQEWVEAWNLKNVMKWFDDHDGDNDDLIFAGDTNIKIQNDEEAFKYLRQEGYKSLLKATEENKTSLARTLNKYSETFDKFFIYSDLKFNNSKKYDIFSFPEQNFVLKNQNNKNVTISSFESWKEFINSFGKVYDRDYSYINSGISDHTCVGFTLELNPEDKH